MEKALTLNELIARLQYAVDRMPELGDKSVVFIDWNDMTTEVSEGIHDIVNDSEGNPEVVVLG